MAIDRSGPSAAGFLSGSSKSNGLTPIHGVAIGSNDITRGHLSGEQKLWTPEVLEEAADTLEGKEIVVDHENRSAREVVGEVTDSQFQEGRGVIYQGVIDDEELEEKIGHGWLEVSPRIIHSDNMEERGELKIPQKIFNFDNLSIVSRGAANSNEVDLGTHEELSAEELQDAFEVEYPDGAVAEFQRRIDENQENVDFARWMFETPEGAQGAVEGFPCEGIHEHEIEGQTWYMPCSSHDEFLSALEEKQSEENSEVEEMVLSEARTPEYDETETQSWSDVPADTLSYYVDALGYEDVESVSDLTDSQKSEIAQHSLLGDPNADNIRELRFFPVVNARTGDLNRGALEAVRGGRGQSADIPESTFESAFSVAGRLLNEEFDADVEVEMEELSTDRKSEMAQIASRLSSHTELTKGQSERVVSALNPNMPEDRGAMAIVVSKGVPSVSQEEMERVLDELAQHGDGEMSEDNEESSDGTSLLNSVVQ